jgi:hypothetical protein
MTLKPQNILPTSEYSKVCVVAIREFINSKGSLSQALPKAFSVGSFLPFEDRIPNSNKRAISCLYPILKPS